ncbi:MAG: RNA polymerase sigma factor RpoH [Rhodospirillales bacterium]|nr:RNA polymerase sigma factor RpoH [Rhodospirillales bacterium]
MATMNLPAVSADGGLARYFREIWAFPVLNEDEEYTCAVRWREEGNVEAAHRLVTSHLRLVAKIAMGYRGYGIPVADLISEGNIGLMKAVKKFEPERGFRLATYAMWWIRAAITEYILRSWSMVKLGTLATQKKLFFSLRRIKRQLNIIDNDDLDPDQAARLSKVFDLPAKDIVDMNRRLTARDASLNAPLSRDGDEGLEFQDTLIDTSPSPEALASDHQESSQRRQLVSRAMKQLPDRERAILAERWLKDDPKTLEQLGADYGISRERVRQLEARALDKVRKSVAALSAEPVEALA